MQYNSLLPAMVALLAALPVNAAEKTPSQGAELSIVAPAESRTTRLMVAASPPTKPQQLAASAAEKEKRSSRSQLKVILPSTEMEAWVEPARVPEIGAKQRRLAKIVDASPKPAMMVAGEKRGESRSTSHSQLRIASVPERTGGGPLVASETITSQPEPRLARTLKPAIAPLASPVEPAAMVAVPYRSVRLAPGPPAQPAPAVDVPKVVVADEQSRPQLAVRSAEKLSPDVKPEPRPASRNVAVAREAAAPTVAAPAVSELSVIEPALPVERALPHPLSAERTVEVARRQMEKMPPTPEPEVAQTVAPVLEPEPMAVAAERPQATAPRQASVARSAAPRRILPETVTPPPLPPSRYSPPVVYQAPPMPKPTVYRGYTVPGRSAVPFAGRGLPVQRPFNPDAYAPQVARNPNGPLTPRYPADAAATADRRHAQSGTRR